MTQQTKSGRINARLLTTLTKHSLQCTIRDALSSLPEPQRDAIPLVLNSVVSILKGELLQRHCIRMIRIGCLVITDKRARTGGRHFSSGKAIKVSARTVVTLRQRKREQQIEFGSNDMLRELRLRHPQLPQDMLRSVYRAFLHQVERIRHGHTRIELRGLGSFYPSYRAAKQVRDPRNGQVSQKEAYIAILFRCSKPLQQQLSAQYDTAQAA